VRAAASLIAFGAILCVQAVPTRPELHLDANTAAAGAATGTHHAGVHGHGTHGGKHHAVNHGGHHGIGHHGNHQVATAAHAPHPVLTLKDEKEQTQAPAQPASAVQPSHTGGKGQPAVTGHGNSHAQQQQQQKKRSGQFYPNEKVEPWWVSSGLVPNPAKPMSSNEPIHPVVADQIVQSQAGHGHVGGHGKGHGGHGHAQQQKQKRSGFYPSNKVEPWWVSSGLVPNPAKPMSAGQPVHPVQHKAQ